MGVDVEPDAGLELEPSFVPLAVDGIDVICFVRRTIGEDGAEIGEGSSPGGKIAREVDGAESDWDVGVVLVVLGERVKGRGVAIDDLNRIAAGGSTILLGQRVLLLLGHEFNMRPRPLAVQPESRPFSRCD